MWEMLIQVAPLALGLVTAVVGIVRDQSVSLAKALDAERTRADRAEKRIAELRVVLDACNCHSHAAPSAPEDEESES